MFKTIVSSTPFTTSDADTYFANKVWGDTVGSDRTFISTLRALIGPRMQTDDSLIFNYVGINNVMRGHEIARPAAALRDLYILDVSRNSIFVRNFSCPNKEQSNAWMEFVKENFAKTCESDGEWTLVEKVSIFFHKAFNVLCYINPDIKSVVLFTDNMDTRKMHYLQCGVLAFFPWYFSPEDKLSDEEMKLIQSLREPTPDKYLQSLSEIEAKTDFRTLNITTLLNDFEKKRFVSEASNLENAIQDYLRDIEEANMRISQILRAKRDADVKLLGLRAKINEGGDSEMLDFFIQNKNLVLQRVSDDTITFCTKGYMINYDPDQAERIINNPSSYVYRGNNGNAYGSRISNERMKKLLQAILVDQTLKVRFCAAFRIKLDGWCKALSNYSYGTDFETYMENPHLDNHSCLGDNARHINDCLVANDYIGAISQCIASSNNLNVSDSVVMIEFMRTLHGLTKSPYSDVKANNKCIELPTGEVVEPIEAIKYLEAQEANGNG